MTVWYFRTFFLYFFPFLRSISSPLFLFPFHCPFLSIAWKLLIDRPFSDFPTLYLTFYCLQLLPFLTPLLHILSLHLSFFFPYVTSSSPFLTSLLLHPSLICYFIYLPYISPSTFLTSLLPLSFIHFLFSLP